MKNNLHIQIEQIKDLTLCEAIQCPATLEDLCIPLLLSNKSLMQRINTILQSNRIKQRDIKIFRERDLYYQKFFPKEVHTTEVRNTNNIIVKIGTHQTFVLCNLNNDLSDIHNIYRDANIDFVILIPESLRDKMPKQKLTKQISRQLLFAT